MRHLICTVALALAATVTRAQDPGFTLVDIPFEEQGKSIIRTDFEHCSPAHIIKVRTEMGEENWLADGPEKDRTNGYWILRHPAWTDALINVVGTPPDLTYDPKLTGSYDIYLGLRAVSPHMGLAVKLSSEKDFSTITAPAATDKKHFDFEFHWKIAAEMDGEKIVIRSVGRSVYLQYIRLVPRISGTRQLRCVTDHVTVCKTKGRHHAFPGITRLPNGNLGVVFRDGIAHVCPLGRIMFLESTDQGRTWSGPVCIAETPSDERDPAIFTIPDQRVAVTFNVWNSWMARPDLRRQYAEQTARIETDGVSKYTGAKIIFSSDNGRTWSEPIKTPPFTPHGFAIDPKGHLYYPTTCNIAGRRYVIIWRSQDGGNTWSHHAEVGASVAATHDADQEVFREPHLAILPDGTWIVAIRVQVDGYVRLAFSRDGGLHWTRPRRTNVKGYPQHLLPLKDGRLLMTYGYRYDPPGVRACLSDDGGKTWDMSNEIILRCEGANHDLGYPVSIELDQGHVLTVYYYVQRDGLCYIEGAFYRP